MRASAHAWHRFNEQIYEYSKLALRSKGVHARRVCACVHVHAAVPHGMDTGPCLRAWARAVVLGSDGQIEILD